MKKTTEKMMVFGHKLVVFSRNVRPTIPRPTQIAAWLVIALFIGLTTAVMTGSRNHIAGNSETAELEIIPANPAILSPADRGLYLMIAQAQQTNDFRTADTLIRQLHNRGLVGYVLAERYLSAHYQATKEELTQWLALYSTQPQATRIAALAAARGAEIAPTKTPEPLRGDGYGEHLGRSGMPDSWYTALNDWREGDYRDAKTIFDTLSSNESLSNWQRSAAHYWAYRAADKLGESHAATSSLKQAAAYPTTFYGLLAAEQLGNRTIRAEAPEVSDTLRRDPRAIRAALLNQLGRKTEAEDELRALHSATSNHQRRGIVTLASELNMPNLQIRLARTPGLSPAEMLFAQFPTPQYMVDLHPVMDAALLLAVARNESGFRELARNGGSGAMGMMQMLPSTARAVERRVGESLLSEASATESTSLIARLSNPALSARYGAEYLKILTREAAIGNSLIHLMVGYNAGPGTVASWNAASRTINDPLLYIESIPYAETRNYVMQVSAQYWVYQMMMDEKPSSLKELARGEWPKLATAKL